MSSAVCFLFLCPSQKTSTGTRKDEFFDVLATFRKKKGSDIVVLPELVRQKLVWVDAVPCPLSVRIMGAGFSNFFADDRLFPQHASRSDVAL